MDIKSINRLLI